MFVHHGAGILAMLAIAVVSPLSTEASAHEFKAGELVLQHPWARATPTGAQVAGGYLTIVNAGSTADRLVGGSIAVAAGFEVHDMAMTGDVMTMKMLKSLEIPAGASVTLAPGGTHLMFTGLRHGLKKGQTVEGSLVFEKAGTVKIDFDVEGIASKGPSEPSAAGPSMPGMTMD